MYKLHANLGILASAAKLVDKSPIMYSQVCCPKPLTICLPGHSCGAKLKCESTRSKKQRIIKDCNECISGQEICRICELLNDKIINETCFTLRGEQPYQCGNYDYHIEQPEDYYQGMNFLLVF